MTTMTTMTMATKGAAGAKTADACARDPLPRGVGVGGAAARRWRLRAKIVPIPALALLAALFLVAGSAAVGGAASAPPRLLAFAAPWSAPGPGTPRLAATTAGWAVFATSRRRGGTTFAASSTSDREEGGAGVRAKAIVTATATVLTSAVVRVAYDGGRFHGWSAANDGMSLREGVVPRNGDAGAGADVDVDVSDARYEYSSNPNGADFLGPVGRRGRGRRRGTRIPGAGTKVRSVEGQLRLLLAKLYGNVDPGRVQVEGCSRTDKGVHARSMVALFYCLAEGAGEEDEASAASRPIPGKRLPHPSSPTDASAFVPLPCGGDIDKIMFCLNRMLPPDVRVGGISPTPYKKGEGEALPFHPGLDAAEKTYRYTFSVGHMHDPTRWRSVWHLDKIVGSAAPASAPFDVEAAREAARCFVGTHDFAAFRGAFRGSERGRVQEAECTLSLVSIGPEGEGDNVAAADRAGTPIFDDDYAIGGSEEQLRPVELRPLRTYVVTVRGDRFLYKMVRFLVGSIVSVGVGKASVEDVRSALDCGRWGEVEQGAGEQPSERRSGERICAPSHGLMLQDVSYPSEVPFEWERTYQRD